tara:strand:- start:311 stop:1993 length:1683 start_codon:yes stop_codon:yes gene_type:complete
MTQYLVTVKKGTDIDAFYNEMETPGGSSTIPDREVTCYKRKPISRTTGYDLEDSEVESLLNDDRVIGIDSQELLDLVVTRPLWEQTSSNWYKGSTISSTMKNWGLYRCILGSQVANWGDDGTTAVSDTIRTTSSGKNVDVVIVDGQFDPNHPEFAVNPDGTGGTRVQQFNWLSLTSQVTGGSNGTYTYRSGTDLQNEDDNHGAHVAGTVAGNTQGWARDANIYYIDPFSGPTAGDVAYDYVRAWHNQKSVNPETGRRNPTIVNSSIGSYIYKTRSAVTGVVYRGTTYNAPESGFTDAQLDSYGIRHYGLHPSGSGVEVLFIPISTSQFTQYLPTIEDLVDDGIILVGAAGNGSLKIDVEDGTDWDNRTQGGSALYYNRGHWQSSTSKTGVGGQRLVVCVGAVSSLVNESKATFSNCGPRVDVFAPGRWIISSVHNDSGGGPTKPDLRNTSYKLVKYNGTSMASPQVCGTIACLLEQYPNMNQSDVMDYINQHAKDDQMTTTSGGHTDDTDLQGADNKYLFYHKERPETGVSIPRYTHRERKATTNGVKYPRTNRMVTKRQ